MILLIASSCSSLNNLDYTLPVKVGKSWQSVKGEMGNPDKKGDNFYTFFEKGIIVYVDAKQELVTAIVCSWFQGGSHFTGKIYGIGLGDTFPKCTQLWGEPVSKLPPNYDYYSAQWQVDKFQFELEFWARDGFDEDLGGRYETDTVKRIKVSLK